MWLINVRTYELEEFNGCREQRYAILSHTWEDKGEVTFQDMYDIELAKTKPGFWKIEQTCQEAQRRQLEYAWVDTCCIDKKSSAELQEAINSMFEWYHRSTICFAFLSDIKSERRESAETACLEKSKWFGRAWTLQELIAPSTVIFFDHQWVYLYSRKQRAVQISAATGIPEDLLIQGRERKRWGLSKMIKWYSVAQRMSWAAGRRCRREEDRAYSLLGLFNVHMPMLYGEGARAFHRLQEQIIRETADLSILLFHTDIDNDAFAISPDDFRNRESVIKDFPWHDRVEISMNQFGWAVKGMTLQVRDVVGRTFQVVLLGCLDRSDKHNLFALRLPPPSRGYDAWIQSDPLISSTFKHGKIWKVDVLYARANAVMRNIAIEQNRDLLNFRSMTDGCRNALNLVWIRMRGHGKNLQWEAVNVWPQDCWDAQRQTLGLPSQISCLGIFDGCAGINFRVPELSGVFVSLVVALKSPYSAGRRVTNAEIVIDAAIQSCEEIAEEDLCRRLTAACDQMPQVKSTTVQVQSSVIQASWKWLRVGDDQIPLVQLEVENAMDHKGPNRLEVFKEEKSKESRKFEEKRHPSNGIVWPWRF